jgi:hypothetical protein
MVVEDRAQSDVQPARGETTVRGPPASISGPLEGES